PSSPKSGAELTPQLTPVTPRNSRTNGATRHVSSHAGVESEYRRLHGRIRASRTCANRTATGTYATRRRANQKRHAEAHYLPKLSNFALPVPPPTGPHRRSARFAEGPFQNVIVFWSLISR